MREIKFKAGFDDKLWNVGQLKFAPDGYCREVLLVRGENAECATAPFESVRLYQFTGLLDKNGKEIYEGHILESVRSDDPVGAVRWHEPTAGWMVYDKSGRWDWLNEELDLKEVIGHIYENPELVKNESNN